jgi:SRSO17 transposase
MTRPGSCPPAPGPLDRNKTRAAQAGAEPVADVGHPAAQRLQFFLSESRWDPNRVNARRLELLATDPATAPHSGAVLVIDDSGYRKGGAKTAHVGHQWLGRYGKTGKGVDTVMVWHRGQILQIRPTRSYRPCCAKSGCCQ